MQLKIARSQRLAGVFADNVVFCIDARAEYTPDEQVNIKRYRLYDEVVYNSEAQKSLISKSEAQRDGTLWGSFKSFLTGAIALTKLHVSVRSLERGQHIECKSLHELLSAEDALMQACQNLQAYLETARTFDGREVLVDFSSGSPVTVAEAVAPEPMLAVPLADATPAGQEWLDDQSPYGAPREWGDEVFAKLFNSPERRAFGMIALIIVVFTLFALSSSR